MPREVHICSTPKCDNNATHACELCAQTVCEPHNYIVASICMIDILHNTNANTTRLAERVAKNIADLSVSFSICAVCARLLHKKQVQRDFRENTVNPAALALFATWPAVIQQAIVRDTLTENSEEEKT